MSRMIKYRVWDTKGSCYITAASESNDGHGLTLDGAFSYCGQSQFGYCPDPARYIAEQFTSLLDSTGREIYEGDILAYRVWDVEPGNESLAAVEYGNGSFDGGYYSYVGFYLRGKDGRHVEPTEITSLTNDDKNVVFTIAGNIHEHANLLQPTP